MTISTAVNLGAVARVVGIKTEFVDLRGDDNIIFAPQRVALFAQGNHDAVYNTDPVRITSAAQIGRGYGFGSPAHLAAMQMFPANGDGLGTVAATLYPLQRTPTARRAGIDLFLNTQRVSTVSTHRIIIGGVYGQEFTLSPEDTATQNGQLLVDSINNTINMPVTASLVEERDDDGNLQDLLVGVSAKWDGESGNGMQVKLESSANSDFSIGLSDLEGGAGTPSLEAALQKVGDVWETILVNGNGLEASALNQLQVFGVGRSGPLTKRHCWALSGYVGSKEDSNAVSKTRTGDFVNALVPAYGSCSQPIQVAARAAARIAVAANNDPAHDFSRLVLDGIFAGPEDEQSDSIEREALVTTGASTTVLKDGLVTLSDTVTFFAPEGEPFPSKRFVVDIVKLQTAVFNYSLRFESAVFDGAPLIPNNQPTTSRSARKPRNFTAAANGVTEGLGLSAIISAPETTKAETQFRLSTQGPKRVEGVIPIRVSGNSNVISIDLNYGFFFGSAQLVV